ncbi:metal ABC transporter solute-binding protein, Zn/Mn family [Salinisphaera sp.]|uniref:metal ABC transporter solute-binding protein, Zn/Mn family n=1 Tax=Salinisphaera sp. TaxID=1914330 RepID=UPI002D7657D2|nr:zinc ABC transporter substrate-binding protein [Salinisphaera sp.]HET7315090.1 zinc ABC transporter substrate-binding protein [Salinisphaera sp.]
MLLFVLAVTCAPAAFAANVSVVAAENSYGSMVRTIGGDHVDVTSLLDSPAVNPHEFKASPRIGRLLASADLVVMNGLGYDGWMLPLLKGTPSAHRRVIKASAAGSAMVMPDDNPHLFYDPRIMLATASAVAHALAQIDPAHKHDYQANLREFKKQLLPIYAKVQALIAAHPNLTVTATEPVFGYMIRLLGYHDLYHDAQFATMEGTQPSAQQVKRFMQGLQQHKVQLLIYNAEVHSRLTQSYRKKAKEAGVPVAAVTELPLHGENYAQWVIDTLEGVAKALDQSEHSGAGTSP